MLVLTKCKAEDALLFRYKNTSTLHILPKGMLLKGIVGDKNTLAYCFGRKVDGVFEIMPAKTMRDIKEFKQEVENLAKYFNADVFWSGD